MGWIYKVTNLINGKMYIGKTEENNPYNRWKEHLNDYKRERFEKRPFYSAMKKYGVENFVFEPIGQFNDSQLLCDKEREYIDLYRTYVGFKDCNGYNATLGGDGKSYLNLNEEDVINYHIANGYIAGRTAKHFKCDFKSITKILEKNNIEWLSSSEITRKNFILNYGGLVQLNNDCTEVIKIYECPSDVYSEHIDYHEKGLSFAYGLHHKTHRYKKYIWYRLNELPEQYKPLLKIYYDKIIDDDNLEIDDWIFNCL